ncbi:MAG: FHA domain-containing protein [Candidatus Eisenbacteria bacterium]|uniref:FHA domain-containing protein n=1 Tax=Eiseniibacteriota bacterium TaxID=2212470 RepID=A0A956RQK8_UNCEI|nr:FHA domain-containing protein [Candidatus Eisenbacteria bacterium]
MNLDDLCRPSSAGTVELAVDLSNVCRNSQIDSTGDPARWDRLLRVLQIWNDSYSAFERPVVVLIADESLRHLLPPEERRLLKQAVQDGFAIETPKADPMLLDLAEECDCLILSNDQFVSYRRGRPWMEQEEAARFVQVRTSDGPVELDLIALRPRSSYSKSRAEEQDELKENRIDLRRDLGADLLRSLFRCENPTCLRRSFLPKGAVSAPERGSGGEAVCPGCKGRLTRVGDARETAVIKLSALGRSHAQRVPLAMGGTITIGRAADDLSLRDLLEPEDLRRVSREHLRVDFGQGGVTATDLNSSNGSAISRWDRGSRESGPPVRLDAGVAVDIRPRDVVIVAGVLCVERSGRRFPFDMEPVARRGREARDEPRTVMHTGEEF